MSLLPPVCAPFSLLREVYLTRRLSNSPGIDPHYVEAAAAELQAGGEGRGRFFFWGAPVSTVLEQAVAGEVPAEEWEALVAKIRRSTGNVGRSSTLGHSLEWTGQTDHMSVSPKEGQTRIHILSGHLESMVLAHTSALMVSTLALGPIIGLLHGTPWEAAGLGAATVGGVFALARSWAGVMYRRHREKMKALLGELAEHVAQTAPPVSEEQPVSRPAIAHETPAEARIQLGVRGQSSG